ncbi:hypothetical protein PoB_004191000 [Plakobranchus ocellatus]|uniref:Uncharacterized protein n=1 Tax=Plakobranchus ocellatus TaxID=259542 RepID=A0AAV4B8I0_9GAST|nr:hypothetical protein PoB_004191000 [Plakobranchus ocellatus]
MEEKVTHSESESQKNQSKKCSRSLKTFLASVSHLNIQVSLQTLGGVESSVVSESALRSAATLLSRVRAPPPASGPGGGSKSLRSPCCGLAIYKTFKHCHTKAVKTNKNLLPTVQPSWYLVKHGIRSQSQTGAFYGDLRESFFIGREGEKRSRTQSFQTVVKAMSQC